MADTPTTTTAAPTDGSIKAMTGSMAEYAKSTMSKIYAELDDLHSDLQSDLKACSGWEGADKDAFNELLGRFQVWFQDIGKTLQRFGLALEGAADVYAQLQATNKAYFDDITYTSVYNDSNNAK